MVDSVGLERFPLIGLSQGGAVAIAYAVRHPERVTRLSRGAYARGRLARARRPSSATRPRWTCRSGGSPGGATTRPSARPSRPSSSRDEPRETWDAFNALQRATTSTENVVRFLDTFANLDVSALAAQVQLSDPGPARPRRPPRTHPAGPRAGRD